MSTITTLLIGFVIGFGVSLIAGKLIKMVIIIGVVLVLAFLAYLRFFQ